MSVFDRLFGRHRGQVASSPRNSRPRRSPLRQALHVESLEQRQMMSVVPVGGETRLHPLITTPQVTWPESPQAVAMLDNPASGNDGAAVVVFSSPNSLSADDGVNSTGVWFRRVLATGDISTTQPVEVNVTRNGPQAFGSVAIADDGSFVIVWSGNGINGAGGTGGRPSDLPAIGTPDGSGIFMRRFDAAGNPRADGERLVNTTVPTGIGQDPFQEHPTIAMDDDGNYIVVWTVREQSGSQNEQRNVYMRRYTAGGVPIDATEVQVNTSTTQVERLATVAMNDNGDFIIIWAASNAVNGDFDLFGRYFSQSGSAATTGFGPVFRVHTRAAPQDLYPSVDILDNGDFIVAWTVGNLVNEDPTNVTGDAEVVFRRFTRPVGFSAAPVAKDITERFVTVNGTAIPGAQRFARVAAINTTGDFTVVWDGLGPDTIDFNDDTILGETVATGGGVFGQRFLADGTPVGGMFRVNTTLAGPQRLAGIGYREREENSPRNHSLFVAWSGFGDRTETGQNDGQGAFFQRYSRQTVDATFTLPGPDPVRYSVLTGGAVVLDPQITVSAPAGYDFNGLTLTLLLTTNGTGADALNPALESLGILDQGPGVDTVDVNGNAINFNNVQIAAFAFGIDPNDPLRLRLTIVFTTQATAASVQAVMRQIFYQNTAPRQNPLLPNRLTTWRFTDAQNITSDSLFKEIQFTGQGGTGTGSRFRKRGFCTNCGSPSNQYATSLYNVLLERDPTSQEVTQVGNVLRAGAAPSSVVSGFLNSPEYRTWLIADPTNGFYKRFLRRDVDAGGLSFWLNAMAHGVTEPQVLAGILGSAEYFQVQGGNTFSGYVQKLYGDLLGRSASLGEVNFYVSRLNSGAQRADIAFGFIHSDEYRSVLAREWYDHYVAITPLDDFRLQNALERFRPRNSWQDVQIFILTSYDAIKRPVNI